MMTFLHKLERKFGKYAIPHLMRYVLGLYVLGYVVEFFGAANGVDLYSTYLMLDVEKLLQGQIWRIVTFLIQPPDTYIVFLIFWLYLYYMIGEALENAWGSFIFNMYFFMGVLFNVLAVVLFYVILKSNTGVEYSYQITLTFINESLFLAFAALFPDIRLLLFFFIPIKMKWLGILEGGRLLYLVVSNMLMFVRSEGGLVLINGVYVLEKYYALAQSVMIFVAMLNFLIFFFLTRNYRRISPREMKRRADFNRTVERARRESGQASGITYITRHKCAVCGRTERDGEELEFRFCSKCNGNYEYCQDHLYTHAHVGFTAEPTEVFRDCEVDTDKEKL